MIPEDIPWTYVLPALAILGFGGGMVYKRLQDHTVRVIRNTIKPGELHVDDLEAYRRERGLQRPTG